MKIANHTVVQIHYTIKLSTGEVVDSTFGEEPLEYVHGVDEIMEGLEKALLGKEDKSSFEVKIPADEAYGQKVDELIFKVNRSQFPPDLKFKIGDVFQTTDQDYEVTIVDVNGDEITIDANHPLAGEDLSFDINILTVREASAEEIENGILNMIDDDDDDCDCGDDDCDCDEDDDSDDDFDDEDFDDDSDDEK